MEQLQEALISLLVVVVGIVASYIGQKGGEFLKKNGILKEIESKKKYVDIVVNAVQQTFKEADGATKLEEAQDQIIDLFNKNGIKFTQKELDALIEAAVKGIKDGASK